MLNVESILATLNTEAAVSACIFVVLVFWLYHSSRRVRTTRLKGPPKQSFIFGATKEFFTASNVGVVYRRWEKAYGLVYEIPPSIFGKRSVVLCDPKAVSHVFSKDTTAYHQPETARLVFGGTLLVMEGDVHKRQRRALSSAFTSSAIRDVTPTFLECANKLKSAWDALFHSSQTESVIIEVQQWMNYTTLDNIGNAGFSHDFGALDGRDSQVKTALDSFNTIRPSLSMLLVVLLGPKFPWLRNLLPNKRDAIMMGFTESIGDISNVLLKKAATEKEERDKAGEIDQSIVGALIRSESAGSSSYMSADEITSQHLLIMAGYETTAIGLTWALIELARNSEIQDTLRAELQRELEPDQHPSYDQLVNGLPYLDAFTCEVMRVHPASQEAHRVANEDDIVPLSQTTPTASGETVDRISIAKGTTLRIPIIGINTSLTLWGDDALKFDPTRWLESDGDGDQGTVKPKAAATGLAAEMQGYRHLITFVSGPRMCIGKNFALMEFKAVISVLVRNFSFELPRGPETEIGSHRSLLPRPKVVGEEGPRVPLIVRKIG